MLRNAAQQPVVKPARGITRPGLLWPLIVILIRFPLIMLGNLIVYGYNLTFTADPTPWNTALLWGNVHTPIIADSVTLLLVIWLMRREGGRLSDLINLQQKAWGREILIGIGLSLILLITLYAGNLIGGLIAFGPAIFEFDPNAFADVTRADLPPLWYYLWGLIVLPISVSIAEEVAYRGYAQPRLSAALGNRWLALIVVALGFGVQHIAFSATDWQSALARFIGTFIAGLVLGFIYLRQQRLLPLIIGHWLVNVIGLGLMPLLFYVNLPA
ncbi:MAG: CPBP family intramembrane glutamic endopeptidase [Chloroflexota bacterium]